MRWNSRRVKEPCSAQYSASVFSEWQILSSCFRDVLVSGYKVTNNSRHMKVFWREMRTLLLPTAVGNEKISL
jgi:hypothetical protein